VLLGKYRVVIRVVGPKSDELTGAWKRLHSEQLNALRSLPNMNRMIISRLRWAEHVAPMGERTG
jgi:hypothetical protein